MIDLDLEGSVSSESKLAKMLIKDIKINLIVQNLMKLSETNQVLCTRVGVIFEYRSNSPTPHHIGTHLTTNHLINSDVPIITSYSLYLSYNFSLFSLMRILYICIIHQQLFICKKFELIFQNLLKERDGLEQESRSDKKNTSQLCNKFF